MAHLDTMEVRHTALEVIFDLLMWYGLHAFMDQENSVENTRNFEAALESNISDTYTQGGNLSLNDLNSQGANPIVAVISKLLDDRDLDIRTKVLICANFFIKKSKFSHICRYTKIKESRQYVLSYLNNTFSRPPSF